MRTRPVELPDRDDWLRMRDALWPGSHQDHVREIDEFFAGTSSFIDQVFVCESADRTAIGFIELQIRSCAEGSDSLWVPYVEGWYVDERYRGRGAGALLIVQAEQWARMLGYMELASDAQTGNRAGIDAHLALGFEEVGRSVCFLKKL